MLATLAMMLAIVPAYSLLTAAPAGAVNVAGFEIDGDKVASTGLDWNSPSIQPQPVGTDGVGSNDATVYSASSKEDKDPSTWTDAPGTAPQKDDFAGIYSYTTNDNNGTPADTTDDHPYVFFAFDRVGGSGTDYYYLELNKLAANGSPTYTPNRSVGDARFKLHDQGNGIIDLLSVSTWNGTGWDETVLADLSQSDQDALLAGFHYAVSSNPDTFVEFAFDLKVLLDLSPSCPEAFGSLQFRNATGESDKNLKDFILPVHLNAGSSCGELKIFKTKNSANGAALAGATFSITPDPRPGHSGGSLSVTDGDSNDADGTSNGTIDINPAQPGVYDVLETAAPAGWMLDPNSHSVTVNANGTGVNAGTVTVVDKQGSIVWQKNDATTNAQIAFDGATFALYGPESTQAAVDASTTVLKTVVDNGSNDEDPAVGALKVSALAGGWYRLHETVAPTGYTVDPTDQDAHITYASPNASLTSTPFVDTRILSKLVVQKLASDGTTTLDGATFQLWQVGTPDTLAGTCVTGTPAKYVGTGKCEVTGLAWGHSYYWKETIPPPGYNLPNPVTSGNIAITRANAGTDLGITTFQDPQTTLTTTATDATIGNSISDTATLGNLNGTISGTLVFRAYGPFATDHEANTVCTLANLKFTSSDIPVTANGNYGPVTFTPNTAGYYYWIATFTSGNTDNAGKTGVCGAASEISHVTPLQPDLVTTATNAQLPFGTITDSVVVSGTTPTTTGDLTVTVYAPSDTSCTTPLDSWTFNDVHNGTYVTDPAYLPTQAGDYKWKAVYVGDANNLDASEPCGSLANGSHEVSHVSKAQPDLVTTATASAQLPEGTIADSVTLSGATGDASGTLTVKVFGPGDTTCSTVLGTWTFDNVGNGTYVTDPAYVPTSAGVYRWYAVWGGDGNNESVDEPCGSLLHDSMEQSTVEKAQPDLVTSATNAKLPDGTIADTVTLSGATSDASAKLTVQVFAASDTNCTTPLQEWTQTGFGNGSYTTTPAFSPPAAGDYKWYASWAGDANNEFVDEPCGSTSDGSHEVSTVSPATPSISTSADASATLVDPSLFEGEGVPSVDVTDSATLTGAFHPTGTMTFTLYGPSSSSTAPEDCTSLAVAGTSEVPVTGSVTLSGAITVEKPGWYFWIASYSGDDNNVGKAGNCGDDNEVTHVTQPKVGLQKTADPATGSIVQPGQQIDYTVAIPNAGDADIVDATVIDKLPAYVVVDESSISDGGVFVAGSDITSSAGTITWTGVDVPAGSSTNLTYSVNVSADVPGDTTLDNLVELGSLSSTTRHVVASGDLSLSKSVVTLAGDNVGSYTAGDPHNTLVYTLTGKATGTLVQTNVEVTDYIPGYDPSDSESGKTTFVAGSTTCSVAGCTAVYDPASHKITWSVGTVTPPATFTVGFKVTIDSPTPGANGAIAAETINNIGFVEADRHVKTPSNKVSTPVTAVLGEKVVKPPKVLPFTGSALPIRQAELVGLLMIAIGMALTAATRRRREH